MLLVVLFVINVPPLNSKKLGMLVTTRRSTSIKPELNTLVPRLRSNKPALPALVAINMPPSTIIRLFSDVLVNPTINELAQAIAPLLTISRLPGLRLPISTVMLLLHNDPAPVTTTSLLLLVPEVPMIVASERTNAPSLIITRLDAPPRPMIRSVLSTQREPAPESRTRLELAPVLAPMNPLPPPDSSAPFVISNWLSDELLPTTRSPKASE